MLIMCMDSNIGFFLQDYLSPFVTFRLTNIVSPFNCNRFENTCCTIFAEFNKYRAKLAIAIHFWSSLGPHAARGHERCPSKQKSNTAADARQTFNSSFEAAEKREREREREREAGSY
jgi:hypothetical protein